jgi:hypothetical protein
MMVWCEFNSLRAEENRGEGVTELRVAAERNNYHVLQKHLASFDKGVIIYELSINTINILYYLHLYQCC